MVAERSSISLEGVIAARDVLDGLDKVEAGAVVVSVGFTNAAVKDLAPREWEELAGYLFALLDREPLKTSGGYAAHRIVLGSLATELRGFAAAAGVPVGAQADLRAATTQAQEHRIRQRLDGLRAAATRYHDDVIESHRAQTGREDDHIPAEPERDEEDDAPAAPVPEIDDDLAFL